MGELARHHYRIAILISSLWLTSCAAVTSVAAVPGSLLGAVANQFIGEEESFAASMETTLAAIQLSLRSMKLDVDILEIQQAGEYAIAFGNARLDGSIMLKKQTERLTTINIKARDTMREESVERAIIETIRTKMKTMPNDKRFQKAGYHNLHEKPTIKSARLGWFRPGSRLEAVNSRTPGWLRITLPSGTMAYLKGSIKNKTVQKAKL
jgi:hypothetical protein